MLAARDKATAAHDALTKGLDPLVEKNREAAPTLTVLNARYAKEFGRTVTPKVAARWVSLVELHGGPLKGITVDKIDSVSIITQLRKVQAVAPSSAKDLRMHLKRLIDFAKVHGFRAPVTASDTHSALRISEVIDCPWMTRVSSSVWRSLPISNSNAITSKIQELCRL